jgi:Ser/Thr protein kinase RdoA (MazF antagonist)
MEHLERKEGYHRRLMDFIYERYGIKGISIEEARRGYNGETWRLEATEGRYFLKLEYRNEHQAKYRHSLEVVEYLCNHGIDFIPRIVKTKNGRLSSRFDQATLGVFAWIDGEPIDTDETGHIEYEMMSRVYPLTKPGFAIPSTIFSEAAATAFFAQWRHLRGKASDKRNESVLSLLAAHEQELERYALRLVYFAKRCQADTPPFFITHGDVSGNLIKNKDGYFIVDWDEAMYAPLERDVWTRSGRPEAIKEFEDALTRNRIEYRLRNECLAFHCYHMFFIFLGEFLDDFIRYGKSQDLKDLFTGWMFELLQHADGLK